MKVEDIPVGSTLVHERGYAWEYNGPQKRLVKTPGRARRVRKLTGKVLITSMLTGEPSARSPEEIQSLIDSGVLEVFDFSPRRPDNEDSALLHLRPQGIATYRP